MVRANRGVLTSLNNGVNMPRVLVLLLLLAAPLAAQDTESLNGSVPGDRRLTLLYEIDFGAGSTSWTLACGLTTNAASGLIVRLIDLDGLASSAVPNPTSIDEAVVLGPGTANAALSGNYSGVREFAVEIETAQGTTASDYAGSLTSNAGLIEFVMQDQIILGASGLKTAVRRFAFWDGTVPAGSIVPVGLELDFGGSSQTVFLRFEGVGTGIERIELFDTTGGSAMSLATFTNPTGGDVTAVPLTHSGKVYIRVNSKAFAGQNGSASWGISAPSGISVRRVGSSDQQGGTKTECSTGTGQSPSWALALLLAGAVVSLRLSGAKRSRPARSRPARVHAR